MKNGIPKYLKPYVEVVKEPQALSDEFEVMASIKCLCGVNVFSVEREKYEESSERKEALRQIAVLEEKYMAKYPLGLCQTGSGGKWWMATYVGNREKVLLEDITDLWNVRDPLVPTYLAADCEKCGKRIEVLNDSKHGYNAMVSTHIKYADSFKTKTKPKCRACGNTTSKITVKIHNTGKDDLFAECDDRNVINDDNWETAFDWITIDLTCAGCGKESKKYIDLETM